MSRLERTHSTRHSTSQQRTRCGKCYFYSRQITTFLFSHIGLCTLLIGYAIIGAFTFKALESENEAKQQDNVLRRRLFAISELANITKTSKFLHPSQWKAQASEVLDRFERDFIQAVKVHGFDDYAAKDSLSPTSGKEQWSFSGALLYSIIVITTIGYGNVAPRTPLGKVTTILYAIIGIPLMLFCLSNIGHAMAHSFKFVYWKCCCYLCVKPPKSQRQRRLRRRRRLMMLRQQQQQQQQQRALLALQQQQQHANNSNLTAVNGDFVEFSSRRPSNISCSNKQQQTSLPAVSNNVQQHLLSTSFEPNSSSSYSPVITPLSPSTGSAVFFQHSNSLAAPSLPPQLLPNAARSLTRERKTSAELNFPTIKSSLARSQSARYHSEQHHHQNQCCSVEQHYPQQQSTSRLAPNSNFRVTPLDVPPTNRANSPLSPVICNRFASLSDECIPSRVEHENDLSQTCTSKLSIAPRRTQSQVRFQRPTVIRRERQHHDDLSINLVPPPFSYFDTQRFTTLQSQPPECFNGGEQQTQQQPHSTLTPYCSVAPQHPYSDYSELDSNDNASDSEDDEVTEKNIPITVCLLLVVGYICGGAWFFSLSEEWTFLDASYFCFVTLSTIGFGDLVPGRTVHSTAENAQTTLAICALYLLFGMALLAMSLNLVKEKVVETVRTIGERIGLLVSDEDEDFY